MCVCTCVLVCVRESVYVWVCLVCVCACVCVWESDFRDSAVNLIWQNLLADIFKDKNDYTFLCRSLCSMCVCVCMHLWVHKCVCVCVRISVCVHKCECVCMHVHLWMHKCVCVLPLHVSSVTLDTSRHTRQSQSQISHENRGIPEHTHKRVCTVIIWPQTLDLLWSVSVCTFLILLQGHLSLTRWPQLWSQSPAWHSSLQRCPHPSCTHTHTLTTINQHRAATS